MPYDRFNVEIEEEDTVTKNRTIPIDRFFSDPYLGRQERESYDKEYEDAICVNGQDIEFCTYFIN